MLGGGGEFWTTEQPSGVQLELEDDELELEEWLELELEE